MAGGVTEYTKAGLRGVFRRLGYDLVRRGPDGMGVNLPLDFSERAKRIWNAVKPHTMTSPERIGAVIDAVEYLVANRIEGAMVECGTWKGGSSMAMALTLKELGVMDRELYLYDTYEGMSEPTEADRSVDGTVASEGDWGWCESPLEEVKANVLGTGYPSNLVRFVKGKVEDTIPGEIPSEISLLRLDTDWYESTKHEMDHLFPRLKQYGVLILDDYGHWQGARRAVDEYIAEKKVRILLNRIDYTGRIAVKT